MIDPASAAPLHSQPLHLRYWPPGVPKHLTLPATSLWYNLEVTATRYPDRPAVVFYDSVVTYRELRDRAEALAGWLQQHGGVARGDRVLLDFQNSPQFVIGYYAILRADAFVVPVNPMLKTDELRHYVVDCGARVVLCAQDNWPQFEPLDRRRTGRHRDARARAGRRLRRRADGADADCRFPTSSARRTTVAPSATVTRWTDAIAQGLAPTPTRGRSRRLVRDAVHVGHDRQAEGLRPHASLGDARADDRRRLGSARAPTPCRWSSSRCSTSPACRR